MASSTHGILNEMHSKIAHDTLETMSNDVLCTEGYFKHKAQSQERSRRLFFLCEAYRYGEDVFGTGVIAAMSGLCDPGQSITSPRR